MLRVLGSWLPSSQRSKPIPSPPSCPEVPRPSSYGAPHNLPCIGNVFYDTLLCTAVHSSEIHRDTRKAILASIKSDEALKAVESMIFKDLMISSLVGTTRAVDLVGGGVKT